MHRFARAPFRAGTVKADFIEVISEDFMVPGSRAPPAGVD
jgi:hypothetical protein